MDFAAGLVQRSFYRRAYMALDQEVGAVGVDADAGKIGAVADAFQPAVEFRQIKIGAEKTGDDNDAGVIAMRHTKAVVNRGRVQQENLGSEERFGPEGSVKLRIKLG